MDLRYCPDCNEEIADDEDICPFCGCELSLEDEFDTLLITGELDDNDEMDDW